ncbi:hypothetical protein E3P99_03101 [Wallemia hederae]|uniref:Cytoplasmic tRNA 2-thiolation protein 2 n=1 Tax=Wallemia hederae TaxID=1540922 RepID=A0A4T0FHF4_9BASI|nr:hypothetical protein E3P99_03101 [Wallemia hederae]
MSCSNPDSEIKDPGAEIPERRTKPKSSKCIKCKQAQPVIQIRHALYCRECFVFGTSGKFLKWFLAHFKPTYTHPIFYVAVSGGPSSRYLLHVLQTQLTPNKGKGNYIRPLSADKLVVIYVDHSKVVPGAKNVRKDVDKMVKNFPSVEVIEADVSEAWRDNEASTSAMLSGMPGQPPNATTSSSTADLFDDTLSTSSKESHLALLTHHIILREARKHADANLGKDKEAPLFFGTSATRVTIKLLSSMSRGRGWSLGSGEVQPESKQYGMRVYQPLLNHSSKEIAYFNRYAIPQESQPVVNATFTTLAPPKSSIDRLTEELVVSLERGFPSTVSTVARTGNKISFAGEEKDGERLCTLCGWPARAKANEWKNGIAITNLQGQSEQDNALADMLCYGCYTNLTDSRARTEVKYALPGWTDEYAQAQKVTESEMRKQFEDCLISDDENDARKMQDLLAKLGDFKVINNDPLAKKIAMTAVSSEGELAVIILEKLAFSDTNLDAQIQQISTAHKLIQQNDVYHVLLSDGYKDGDKAAESQKTTVIYPATQKHVDKFSKASITLFRETPRKYRDIVKPYIDSLPAKETKWIQTLVSGKAENETYYYKGKQFVIAADYKWDKKDLNTLYLQAVVKDMNLKCLRDLRSHHLPLLRSIRKEVGYALMSNWGLDLSQVKLAVHYQPTFYVFHVHVVSVNYSSFPGLNVGQAHLLDDIIEMLSIDGEIFTRMTLTYHLSQLHKLHDLLIPHESDKDLEQGAATVHKAKNTKSWRWTLVKLIVLFIPFIAVLENTQNQLFWLRDALFLLESLFILLLIVLLAF